MKSHVMGCRCRPTREDSFVETLSGPMTARRARLKYVSGSEPGITRRSTRRGFIYRSPTGAAITGGPHLARIRKLAIPPAWEDVWICPIHNGHLQATGFDVRGRKQYRYHADWTLQRNRSKFETLRTFGATLAALRQRIDRDLQRPGMPKEKVAACIVHLMDRTFIRVGNSEYARTNDSYGLTTIHNGHAAVSGERVRFRFKAKSGKVVEASIESRRAAQVVRRCQELPGQELFCYVDERGRARDVGSSDVNAYLAEITGEAFTAKDFRTWAGTCIAADTLRKLGPGRGLSKTQLKHREVAAVNAAAKALGNTAAVCRKFYVHHALMEAYASGRLEAAFERAASVRTRGLSVCERAVLLLLKANGKSRVAA